jgi:urea transport system permease protein
MPSETAGRNGEHPQNGDVATLADAIESRQRFERSHTFVARLPDPQVIRLRQAMVIGILLLGFVLIPALNLAGIVPDYRVNRVGKYLCFAILAIGIDLVWGYTGILSLCQALFFCIGGYAMAMHLSLPQGGGDVRPEYNNIPQFMFFNNLTQLPWFWKPFASLPFTVAMCVFLPAALASVLGFLIFRSRVRGVYFAIVTQAIAWAGWLLISRNEMLLGGTNGLTNFNKGFTTTRGWILTLYLITLAILVIGYLVARYIVNSRLGRVLVAVRDRETRLYFAGYQPYAFKVFAFGMGAIFAGVGGMLYPAQMGIITPQDMSVVASIFMVICVAAGGRGRLWGAVYGAILINVLKSSLSSDLPSVWPFIEGLIYVGVVLFFRDGFVGVWSALEEQVKLRTGFTRISINALPLAIVSLFVLLESLGLQPAFLQMTSPISVKGDPVQWKYVVLVGLLTANAAAYYLLRRQDMMTRLPQNLVPATVVGAGRGLS